MDLQQQLLRQRLEQRVWGLAHQSEAYRMQAAIAVQFGQFGQFAQAFTLLQARPSWLESGQYGDDLFARPQLLLKFGSLSQIMPLLALYRTIAKVASEWEIPRVVLTWKGAPTKQSYQITAAMGEGDDIFDLPPPLNLDVSIVETMRLGEVIRGSEYPMGLIINRTDWQVWANQPLAVMCQKPIETLITMNVRNNWVDRAKKTDDGLSTVKDRLAVEPTGFDLPYITKVSADATSKTRFYSNFKLVLNGRCRLTTIYNYQPV